MIGARTEVFVHRVDHRLSALVPLGLTLGQQVEVRNLGADEQIGCTIRARCYARTTTDACRGVHRCIGNRLWHRDEIGIGRTTCGRRDVPASLDDAVKSRTIHHEVLHDGEGTGAPWLDHDRVVALERTHVQLAGCGGALRTVCLTIDHQRARSADAFTTVVVENDGLLALRDESLIEHIQHLQERRLIGDGVDDVGFEIAFGSWSVLSPDLDGEILQRVAHL